MGLFSRLFGDDSVIDAGINGIDKAFYTDEEKDENNIIKTELKAVVLKAYEPFKIAQRLMMLVVGIPYVLCFIGAFIGSFWVDTTAQMQMLDGRIGAVFEGIALFYFGGGLIEGGIKAFKGK